MHFIRIALYSFRLIATPALLITLVCTAFLWQSGSALFLVSLFWTKIITTLFLIGFVWLFRSSAFYFYHNLGLSLKNILLAMVLIDWLVAMLLLGGVATQL
jgi:hypothetical protein